MKAVVLAGGQGTRLKPLTERRPKPLIPVAGRPCIDYILRSLVSAKIRQIVITTGYMSDKLIQSIGDGMQYDASILYSFEERPAGTAGAVKRAGHFVDQETFVVASGDVLADVDIAALVAHHKKAGALATIALTESKEPTEFGIVGLDGEDRIVRFQEKPKPEEVFSHWINAGIYVLEPEVLRYIPEQKECDFSRDVFPALLAEGKTLSGKRLEGLWMDIGRHQDLLRASVEIIRRQGKELDIQGVDSRGPVILGQGVTLEKGVRIRGPAYIGDNSFLSRGTLIQDSCIYDNVFVDRGAVIQESIILSGSRVGWQSEIRSSIVSTRCTIEEDVRLVNSIVGDDMRVKIHSRLEDASIAPPSET